MSQSEVERRITQQGADIEGIYEIVTQLKTTQDFHTTRFDRVDARLKAHDARFDGLDARIDGVDARLDGIDAKLAGHDARFDAVDARFDRIDTVLTEVLRRLPG